VYSFIVALALTVSALAAQAAPVKPVLHCDRPITLFGGSTVLADGVRARGSTDFATRLRVFVRRVCGKVDGFEVSAHRGGSLLDEVDEVARMLREAPPGIAIVHYPSADIEAGATVEALLAAYRKIAEACVGGGSICIIGGQQPVNQFSREQVGRQLRLEREAVQMHGRAYLPMYRYFESEFGSRNLMLSADSGDGRHIDDVGHELLYKLYLRRLLELNSD